MTMACIDRYMISSKNVYLRELANPRIAYSIMIKIVIICIILPVHNLIFLNIPTDYCVPSLGAFAFYHALFTFLFCAFLPTLIMIISAILIRSNLASKRARRNRNNYREDENGGVRLLNARDHQVLMMLSIQIIFYMISTIPWIIFLLYGTYLYYINNRSSDRAIRETFIMYVTEIILYLYPTLSFYIYTLTSKTFRTELVNIINKLFIHRYRSRHVSQPLKMQVEVGEKGELVQSNKICQFKPIQMETFLDSSQKTDASLEQQQEANPLN